MGTDTDTISAMLKLKLLLKLPLKPMPTDTTEDTTDMAVLTDTMDTVVDTTDTTTKAPSRSRYKNSTPPFHQDQPKLKQFFETSNTKTLDAYHGACHQDQVKKVCHEEDSFEELEKERRE